MSRVVIGAPGKPKYQVHRQKSRRQQVREALAKPKNPWDDLDLVDDDGMLPDNGRLPDRGALR